MGLGNIEYRILTQLQNAYHEVYTHAEAANGLLLATGLLLFLFFPFSNAFALFKSRPSGSSFLTW